MGNDISPPACPERPDHISTLAFDRTGSIVRAEVPVTPVIRWLSRGQAELCEPMLVKWWQEDGEMSSLMILAGYRTDLASIPQMFRDRVDIWACTPASLPHDWIYEAHGGDRLVKVYNGDDVLEVPLVDWATGKPMTLSRRTADEIFYAVALATGVPHMMAYIAYLAVRGFGRRAWEDTK